MKLYQQRAKSDVDKNIYYTSLICIAEQAFAIASLLDHVIICDSMTCEGVIIDHVIDVTCNTDSIQK
jgi:hypothetical protein